MPESLSPALQHVGIPTQAVRISDPAGGVPGGGQAEHDLKPSTAHCPALRRSPRAAAAKHHTLGAWRSRTSFPRSSGSSNSEIKVSLEPFPFTSLWKNPSMPPPASSRLAVLGLWQHTSNLRLHPHTVFFPVSLCPSTFHKDTSHWVWPPPKSRMTSL